MKKVLSTLLVLCLLMSGCSKNKNNDPTPSTGNGEASKQLAEFLRNEFVTDLSNSKISAHFACEDLSAYGLENMETSLGDPNQDFDYGTMRTSMEEMKKINYNELTDKEKNLYDRYYTFLELNVQYEGLDDYSFAFTPYSGAQDNLVTTFTEFVVRSEQDLKDVVVYLNEMPEYIQALLDKTKRQFEKGIYQNDNVIDGIIDSVETYTSKTGTDNVIYQSFAAQIDKMSELSDEQKADYKAQILDGIDNSFIPSYKNIITTYKGLKGTAKTDGSLYEWEDGRKYYEILLKDKASTDKTPNEIAQDLYEEIETEYQRFMKLYMQDSDIVNKWQTVYEKSYGNSETILESLNKYIKMNYPEIEDVKYSVNYLDPTSVSESVAAYYLNPAVDNLNNNVIKVNPSVSQDLDLYTTLAHEGFPGHCYQNMYEAQNNYNPILYYMNFIGYTEGWAVYAQMSSIKYTNCGSAVAEFTAINDALTYLIISYVDVEVNGCGWTKEECVSYCNDWGFNGESIYELVIGDPAMYVPYGYGYLQQKQIREHAESELGDKFNEKEYNTVILDCGFSMYEYVEKQVDAYIKSKK